MICWHPISRVSVLREPPDREPCEDDLRPRRAGKSKLQVGASLCHSRLIVSSPP
jgi:hypothetical protein